MFTDASAPAASKRRRKSLSENDTPRLGEAHVHFIRDVELAIDSWLESVGEWGVGRGCGLVREYHETQDWCTELYSSACPGHMSLASRSLRSHSPS